MQMHVYSFEYFSIKPSCYSVVYKKKKENEKKKEL